MKKNNTNTIKTNNGSNQSFEIVAYDSLEEMVENIKKNSVKDIQKTISTNKRLIIDISHISEKHQNNFMDNEKIRYPNPMDVITLHNEIICGNVSEEHFGSDMVSKIDKLYNTLKSYIDSICVYDNTTDFALNQEIGGSENFYFITKELSKHFYTDIIKIDKHLPTLTELSYGDDYYHHRNSISAMYVSLYIEATLDIGAKGNK